MPLRSLSPDHHFDSLKTMAPAEHCDFLVMGAGVAGLRGALDLAAVGNVLVVTKESVRESNTHYAQGGIAVAEPESDDIALHLDDTVGAGDGLVYRPAAEVLVGEGPMRVAELIEWGARFDRENGRLMRTREGAHSRPRILHANGDATGAEISRLLAEMARTHNSIHFAEWTSVTGLVVEGGRVIAADLLDRDKGASRISARAVLVAAGGAGQVYSDTTNPAVATGDGIGIAAQAGAELADMEFYQFHPTAFSMPRAPRFLLSEALRGEGAYLRNHAGGRFMERYHPRLELAPRDVVARAVAREGMGESPAESLPVYLDMRHVRGVDLQKRFPGISAFLSKYGLDLHRDLIPIRPAAHYLMGGIRTDLDGRTTVRGLYAAGEASCTGVHGANRLASNSLLEGLVFGARAGYAMREELVSASPGSGRLAVEPAEGDSQTDTEQFIRDVQQLMWAQAGIVRSRQGLTDALHKLQAAAAHLPLPFSRRNCEARNIHTVALLIVRSALARLESLGAHYRTYYPAHDDVCFKNHSIGTDKGVRFV